MTESSERSSIDARFIFLAFRLPKCLRQTRENNFACGVSISSCLLPSGTPWYSCMLHERIPNCNAGNDYTAPPYSAPHGTLLFTVRSPYWMSPTIRAMTSISDSRGGSSPHSLQRPEIVDRSARIVSSTESTPDSSKSYIPNIYLHASKQCSTAVVSVPGVNQTYMHTAVRRSCLACIPFWIEL